MIDTYMMVRVRVRVGCGSIFKVIIFTIEK